ncbi:MAG TPA: hypothetical protein PK431_05605 [Chitinophagales bacterium]|nr:hypothetical protein [Chitinophagales bacterium]
MENSKSYEIYLFVLLFVILFILEIIACDLSYENYGWSQQLIFNFSLVFNLIPAILYILKKKEMAICSLLLIASIIIPKQFILANDLSRLREEVANIANYSYRMKLTTGKFPIGINDYKFKYEDLKDRIDYTNYKDKDDFEVWYYV